MGIPAVTTIEQDKTATQGPEPTSRLSGSEFTVRPFVVRSICVRDLTRYFTNVAGYVFIVLFIVASSVAAFWPEAFFANNLATLDQLNELMPYLLLLFVPAITMATWADERRQGTEELLLTLPARDLEVVLGKYLAALGVYTAALAFLALGLTWMLLWMGEPDLGVLLATYIGYWLMGAMLLALGMVASLLSSNVTVAFILGSLFCAAPVFGELVGGLFGGGRDQGIAALSAPSQFRDFGRGVLSISGLVYFLGLTAAMLFINMVLVGRRHWAGGERSQGRWGHSGVRIASVIVAVLSLEVLVAQAGWRVDLSAEGLSTLSRQSQRLVREIPSDRPVYIEAFLSPRVPQDYVETKQTLIALLRSYDAIGGSKIRVNLIETDRYSEEARRAESQYGISPRSVRTVDETRIGVDEILLGVAFTSGPEQVVIPFFDRGLPVEYELTRSIRTVSGANRRRVGILETDAELLGGFDFQAMSQPQEWEVVTELKKQYEVVSVPADAPIPDDLDALLVPQPSSLTQPEIDNLVAFVEQGGPTLLFLDPLPYTDRSPQMSLAPTQPKESPGGPFGGGPPPEPKGDLSPLLRALGIEWPLTEIVWNPYNPHPKFSDLPSEFVFITPNSGADPAFNPTEPMTAGLQELVALFPGHIRPQSRIDGPEFIPLVKTNNEGGAVQFQDVIAPGLLGMRLRPERAAHFRTREAYTLAARIEGAAVEAEPEPSEESETEDEAPGEDGETDEERRLRAVVIADLDLISDAFFMLRQSGSDEFDFNNVTFVLNCVDTLVGDDSFIDLRRPKQRLRTLTRLEAFDREFEAARLVQEERAEEEAEDQLEAARQRMNEKIEEIQANDELDERTKRFMLDQVREIEQRRLNVAETNIEDQKERKIEESIAEKERRVRRVHARIRLASATLPALPALALGLVLFAVRRSREHWGANPDRLA